MRACERACVCANEVKPAVKTHQSYDTAYANIVVSFCWPCSKSLKAEQLIEVGKRLEVCSRLRWFLSQKLKWPSEPVVAKVLYWWLNEIDVTGYTSAMPLDAAGAAPQPAAAAGFAGSILWHLKTKLDAMCCPVAGIGACALLHTATRPPTLPMQYPLQSGSIATQRGAGPSVGYEQSGERRVCGAAEGFLRSNSSTEPEASAPAEGGAPKPPAAGAAVPAQQTTIIPCPPLYSESMHNGLPGKAAEKIGVDDGARVSQKHSLLSHPAVAMTCFPPRPLMYCTECIGAWWRATTVTAFVARSHTDALFEASPQKMRPPTSSHAQHSTGAWNCCCAFA